MKARSTRSATPPQDPPSVPKVAVVEVEPLIVPEKKAGDVIGRGHLTMRNWRMASASRVAQGLPPLGPPWVELNGSIYYRLEDLRRWVDERAVYCGRSRWRGAKRLENKPGAEAEP